MRFFKYLVFSILSLISINVFADYQVGSYTGKTMQAACDARYGSGSVVREAIAASGSKYYRCYDKNESFWESITTIIRCPDSGMPLVTYFTANTPAPTQVCKPNPDGTFCVYNYGGTSTPKNPLIISANDNKQQIILNSVSSIPLPSCTPQFHKTSCDSKDPYGGCYKPSDDQCNRMADGSIYCPPDASEPDVSDTCNGATYCKRPPQGCGKGYVSGSFNGQQLCVKTSPSTDNPSPPNEGDSGNTGEGTGTSTSTGTETTTTTTTNSDGSTSTSTSTTTTNNTTINNFKIDLSGVIAAVNSVSAQVSSLKNELLTSISQLSSKLDSTNSKLDSTNSKLDTTNSKLTDLNTSSLKQEQLLKDIRDKTVTDPDQPASVPSTDLTGVHTRLDAIKEGIDKKNEFDKEFSEWAKDPDFKDDSNPAFSGDSKVEIQQSNTAPDLKDNYVTATASCPPPLQISFNLLRTHTLTFSYDTMCLGASFARSFVIFSGMLIAFLIVTGSYRGSSDA